MDFKDIIRNAASRKLVDLAKLYLSILDELKEEESANLDKISLLAETYGFKDDFDRMRPFVTLLNENKKKVIRKRILDKTNELIRELES